MSASRAPGEGGIVLVPTPLGNLEDLTLRALRTLRECDVVLAEDTRRTRNLLRAFEVDKPLERMDEHSSPERIAAVLERARGGTLFAVCSDAGTPLVSDPGAPLLRAALELGVKVESLPGPCAAVLAFTLAGMEAPGFRFVGFFPREGTARRSALAAAARDALPTIFYEAPTRLGDTLRELSEICGPTRRAAVARELTKLHEAVTRGSLEELCAHFSGEVLGELTVVLEGATEAPVTESAGDLERALRAALAAGLKPSQAAREVSRALGLPRADVYRRALELGPEER